MCTKRSKLDLISKNYFFSLRVTYFLTECERFHDQLKFPLQLQRDKQKKQKSKTKKDPNVLFGLEKLDEDVPDIKFDNAFFNQNKVHILNDSFRKASRLE